MEVIHRRLPDTRRPTHPGKMLKEFMEDYHVSVAELARRIGVSRQTINELLRERRAMTADMAIRLSCIFGISADTWLNLQEGLDLWEAREKLKDVIPTIEPMYDPEPEAGASALAG